MEAIFQPVDLQTWERRPYFDYYYSTIKCKYTLNANIDITMLLAGTKERGLKFFPTFLYVILRAVNRNREFRMGFDAEGRLGYWSHLIPSYTIFHEDDKTFSDVWSEYDEDFSTFYRIITSDIETYRHVKGIKARPERPANFCSISALPWLSFTGFAQDTYEPSDLLFPLIRFGKYFAEGKKTCIPLAVFVNHAVADGYHTSKLINDIQHLLSNPNDWMT